MDAARIALFERLALNLEDLTSIYRQLLDLVRVERDLLISTNLEKLQASNETKESLLMKVRLADELRLRLASDVAKAVGADSAQPRLLEIAQKAGGDWSRRFRELHATLDQTIRQVQEANRENERHAQSGLRLLSGAMGEIKETIAGKKTYSGKGQYKVGPEVAGNFVRKEV